MDCGIVVSEFVFQSHYYVHFRAKERYEPSYPPSYGLNSTTTVLRWEWIWHEITYKGWYGVKTKEPNQSMNDALGDTPTASPSGRNDTNGWHINMLHLQQVGIRDDI